MATSDMPSREEQAIVELLLRDGRSYENVGRLSATPAETVREIAHGALVGLAPFSAARVDGEWQQRIADYVLGQQPDAESQRTREYLKHSEAARSWALVLLDSLDGLYDNGARRPVLPVASAAATRGLVEYPRAPALRPPRVLTRAATAVRSLSRALARPGPALVGPILLTCAALAMWALSLRVVDLREVDDYGLVSVLPATMFLSLLVLTGSYCVSLRRRALSVPVLLLHLVALIVILYGTPALIEDAPRFTAAWRHVGVAESVMRTGSVDPDIDAYFNWPGFFIFIAFVTKVAGMDSALSFLDWSPVFFNLLYLAPLLMILRAVTNDARLIWLSLWVFYIANWIGQDYFSPQATSFFLFLVIVGVLLTWFRTRERGPLRRRLEQSQTLTTLQTRLIRDVGPGALPRPPRVRAGDRVALMAIVILIFLATVPSHQLTPFAMLGAALALAISNQARTRSLPVLMAVAIGAWVSFMTVSYLAGNISELLGRVGAVQESASANVSGRVQGSPEHILVVKMRLVTTALFWSVALLGAMRRLREGHKDFAFMALAIAAFPLFALQPYGGEMIIRVYLFTLPFMAFFAAALFYSTPRIGRSWLTTAAIGALSVTLLGGFLFTRYGNERSDAFSSREATAVERLYEIAEPGSVLIAGSGNLPWRYRDYEQHEYAQVTDLESWRRLVVDPNGTAKVERELAQLAEDWRDKGRNSYVVIARGQGAYNDLLGGAPRGSLDRVEAALRGSSRFREVYANRDARIFVPRTNHGKSVPPTHARATAQGDEGGI